MAEYAGIHGRLNRSKFSKWDISHVSHITIVWSTNLTVILVENKGFLYELTVILKNIGHFGNHSTYSVITVILVQKTVILPQ